MRGRWGVQFGNWWRGVCGRLVGGPVRAEVPGRMPFPGASWQSPREVAPPEGGRPLWVWGWWPEQVRMLNQGSSFAACTRLVTRGQSDLSSFLFLQNTADNTSHLGWDLKTRWYFIVSKMLNFVPYNIDEFQILLTMNGSLLYPLIGNIHFLSDR